MDTTPKRSERGAHDTQLDSLVPVLDCVRRTHARTRRELVERTGLTRAVVAQRVSELVERGLVEEGSVGVSSGGRAPRLLRFRGEAAHLLVADLGATGVDVALTDLGGRILQHASEPIEIAAGPVAVLGRVDELFERVRREAPAGAGPLWGIGIGVPGPVEFGTGRVVSPPIMPGWDEFPIREHFERHQVPVWVDNDVNVMALGELRAGVARGHETVVFVKIGTGIGAGMIVDGKIHRGVQGCAGDVGHIQVTDDATVVCRCGNVGCLEALAGGAAITRAAEQAVREGRSPVLQRALDERGALSAADVGWAATHGDQVSVELIGRAAQLVGGTLSTLVNVLNPSLIVIGGGVARVGDLLLATIRQTVYGRSLPLATRTLSIQRTSLGSRCGVTGAAAMVADELFSRHLLASWLDSGAPVGRPELAWLRAGRAAAPA